VLSERPRSARPICSAVKLHPGRLHLRETLLVCAIGPQHLLSAHGRMGDSTSSSTFVKADWDASKEKRRPHLQNGTALESDRLFHWRFGGSILAVESSLARSVRPGFCGRSGLSSNHIDEPPPEATPASDGSTPHTRRYRQTFSRRRTTTYSSRTVDLARSLLSLGIDSIPKWPFRGVVSSVPW